MAAKDVCVWEDAIMAYVAEHAPRNVSPYYTYFQALFDAIDTASFYWQPLLRAVGSSQLEIASLQARQAQAMVHWAHQMMRFGPPMDVIDANARLWQTMLGNCVDAAPRVAAAANSATQSVVAPITIPFPESYSRDTLILLDRTRDDSDGAEFERRVA
ncbi:MAG TPA: hypothetical protein VHE81_15255 [Lacipirellulaceae bacterium]|nr:hypothetical protein [Lacipirellulaceae bacterium]